MRISRVSEWNMFVSIQIEHLSRADVSLTSVFAFFVTEFMWIYELKFGIFASLGDLKARSTHVLNFREMFTWKGLQKLPTRPNTVNDISAIFTLFCDNVIDKKTSFSSLLDVKSLSLATNTLLNDIDIYYLF